MGGLRATLSRLTIGAKLAGVTAVLLAVIGGIMLLSARSGSVDHRRALVNNVAGRQPALVYRYIEEVLLRSHGQVADPEGTRDALRHTSDALLDGGAVLAVQGNDTTIHISGQTDPTVRAKLAEFRRLVDELTVVGDRLLAGPTDTPAWLADTVRASALVHVTANVGNDAVGRMTTVSQRTVRANAQRQIELAALGIVLALGLSWLLGRTMVRRLRVLTAMAQATAGGDLDVRFPVKSGDEIGELGAALNDMTDNLAELLDRLEVNAARDGFSNQLLEAFEMADEEADAHTVVERAMAEISESIPMEVLLADSSEAHLERVATNPSAGCPGCPVESPFSCMAVRRGSAVVFDSSEALSACSKLQGRGSGAISAVCVPVTFMGKALGVVHATGPDGSPPDAQVQAQLAVLAAQAGSRIGTVRAFQQSQLQATTDGLTGLINRRTLENQMRQLVRSGEPFAIAMADLDRFKQVNDTFGHDGGDRALRLFSQTMRQAVRGGDIVCRYGGEEFVIVVRNARCGEAVELLDRLRVLLAAALNSGDTPSFTASFGVTDSRAGESLDDLLRVADQALLRAKAEGRNRVVAQDPDQIPSA
jgi:diguanylate cyclase (GGDEF)-like protein